MEPSGMLQQAGPYIFLYLAGGNRIYRRKLFEASITRKAGPVSQHSKKILGLQPMPGIG